MKPEERAELGQQLRDQSLQQGYDFTEPASTMASSLPGPDYPTELTAHIRREHPDLLEDLIGDGDAGLVDSIFRLSNRLSMRNLPW